MSSQPHTAASSHHPSVHALAQERLLGPLLDKLHAEHGPSKLLAHWTQGEFHHDLVFQLRAPEGLPGEVLVVATNCNAGVKEVLVFDDVPERYALWHHRCPDNPAFQGDLPPLRARATTEHWFDPCELLKPEARSELRPEYRARDVGGGWVARTQSKPRRACGGDSDDTSGA